MISYQCPPVRYTGSTGLQACAGCGKLAANAQTELTHRKRIEALSCCLAPRVLCWSVACPRGDPYARSLRARSRLDANSRVREFILTRWTDGLLQPRRRRGPYLILRSRWRNGEWTSPKPVGFSDGTFRDVDPFVTSDGQRLFFTTDRTESGSEPSPDFDIWVAERDGDAWGTPERLPFPPNSSASEAFVSVTEGGTLYFSSTGTSDGVRRVFRTELVDGVYGPREEVGLALAKGVGVGNPLSLPDGSALIFTSRDLPGAGGVDLFISYRDANGKWSEPVALPRPINSPYSDFAPGLGADGRSLFFTSERPGLVKEGEVEGRPPGDLYFVRLPDRNR